MSMTGGTSFAVHPEHVQLAVLISALVSPPSYQMGWGAGFDGPTAQRLLALFLLEEVQDTSTATLTPLPALITRLQQQLDQAGSVLASAVVVTLRNLLSPDDVLNMFQDFSTMLAPAGSTPATATDACCIPYIATSSPLGLFLRRVRVGLNCMSVQGLAVLAAQIQQQVQQLDAQQAAAFPGYEGSSPATVAAAGHGSTGALKDQAVLEAYANQLLSAVESQGPSLPASVVEAATAELAELRSELPKLEYLRMAVSSAHKDLHAALASLHKYFDSNGSTACAVTSVPGIVGSAAAAAGGGGSKGKGRHQAALHCLAALHAHLNHPQESRAALQELLRLGQQHGDEWGLMHALAGLCRVMGMSEGLQQQGSSNGSTGAAAAAGWGLLDFRRTEQQLQLQALLRRCLNTARDMRAPHIAAFAAVALCRFGQQHASAAGGTGGNSGDENLSAEAAAAVAASDSLAADGSSSSSTATAATSIMIQRMLLDVATLQHQAAIAAAAPGTPAVAAAAPNPAHQGGVVGLVTRNTDLYNPTEAFGTGTSTTPGSVTGAPAASKQQPPGLGWRAAAAAVSQALATAHLVAAAGMTLQGATSHAAVRLLMLLTGPGGLGTASDATVAKAAAGQNDAGSDIQALQGQQQQEQLGQRLAAAAGVVDAPKPQQLALSQSASGTGCGVRYEDIASGWGLLTELVTDLQGLRAGQVALSFALSHFPGPAVPPQLAAAQQQLKLQAALQCEDLPAAKLACQALQCLAPTLPQLGVEVQLAAAKAHALMQAAAGCYDDAHTAAASWFATAAASGMQPQAVDALLLMSRACYAAGDLAGALPGVLSALLHCQQLRLDAKLPEAVLLLAAAWQGLQAGTSGFCLQMLQQVLPLAYSCGTVKLQGEIEEAIAKAQLHLAYQTDTVRDSGMSAPEEQTGEGQFGFVAQRLAAAALLYEQAGAWPAALGTWMMLAHVHNAAGQENQRNLAAAKWHAAQQRLGSAPVGW